jgi:hypothetical protein
MEKMLISIKQSDLVHRFKQFDFGDHMRVHQELLSYELDPIFMMQALLDSPIYEHGELQFRFMLFPDAFILLIRCPDLEDDLLDDIIDGIMTKLSAKQTSPINEEGFMNIMSTRRPPSPPAESLDYLYDLLDIHCRLVRTTNFGEF